MRRLISTAAAVCTVVNSTSSSSCSGCVSGSRGTISPLSLLLSRRQVASSPGIGGGEPQLQSAAPSSRANRPATATATVGLPEEGETSPETATTTAEHGEELPSSLSAADAQLSKVDLFQRVRKQQLNVSERSKNEASIPLPERPEMLTPEFTRMKRSAKTTVLSPDEEKDGPILTRLESCVPLPPPVPHPWVDGQPIGRHITHGDGQMKVVGTGQVPFDDKDPNFDAAAVAHKRGYRMHTNVGRRLPQKNGAALQDIAVKHSLKLSGRGLFASKDIKQGEVIMVVSSMAQGLGYAGDLNRVKSMTIDLLKTIHESVAALSEDHHRQHDHNKSNQSSSNDDANIDEAAASSSSSAALSMSDELDYFHRWILTGQQSSLVEWWTPAMTEEVIDEIGGRQVLDDLEIHPLHVARLAAVIDHNSLLTESFYAERQGLAYFPEASLLNHHCAPNATYDVMPEHSFRESDYYRDVEAEAEHFPSPSAAPTSDAQGTSSVSGHDGVESDSKSKSGEEDLSGQRNGNEQNAKADGDASSTLVSGGVSLALQKADFYLAAKETDLTVSGAPTQLFCCRASKSIKAGEEVFVSYVPTGWTHDQRQYELLDRYKFRCRCSRCAPTVDAKHTRTAKFMVVLVLFFFATQLMLSLARTQAQKDYDAMSAEDQERAKEDFGFWARNVIGPPQSVHEKESQKQKLQNEEDARWKETPGPEFAGAYAKMGMSGKA